jgi:hypothetical protein
MTAISTAGPLSTGPLPSQPHAEIAALLTAPHSSPDTLITALRTLTWKDSSGSALPPLADGNGISVKHATALLSKAAHTAQRNEHKAFVRLALGGSASPQHLDEQCQRFRSTQRAAWRLPCTNTLKQPLWILAVNGIPGSRIPGWRCPCCL